MSFKPGDRVQLNTGGPAITVRELSVKGDIEYVTCDWFSHGKPHEARYPVASLSPWTESFPSIVTPRLNRRGGIYGEEF